MNAGEALIAGTCRFCGCQEHTPCEGGCAWTDATQTLCTTCMGASTIAIDFVRVLGALEQHPPASVRLVVQQWDALSLESQRILVLTCRVWLDQIQVHVATELGERAFENANELGRAADSLRGLTRRVGDG